MIMHQNVYVVKGIDTGWPPRDRPTGEQTTVPDTDTLWRHLVDAIALF